MKKAINEIKGFEVYEDYYVTSDGKVISEKRDRAIELKPADNGVGYLKVILCSEGAIRSEFVHRLVALAFVEGYQEHLTVDHIDNNPHNNDYTNLQWMTIEDNVAKGTSKTVYKLTLDGKVIEEYSSIKNAHDKDDAFSRGTFSRRYDKGTVLNNYLWSFEEDLDYNLGRKVEGDLNRVVQLTKDMDIINVWDYASQASNEADFCSRCISDVLRGVSKTHKGFIWAYESDLDMEVC